MTEPLDTPSCEDCRRIGLDVPEWLCDLEAAVGPARLGAFLAEFSGREFDVPRFRHRSGNAHQAVSDWMRRELGYGKFVIPKGPQAIRHRMTWSIYRRLTRGEPVTRIAHALGCHIRTVGRHRSRMIRDGLLPRPHTQTEGHHP